MRKRSWGFTSCTPPSTLEIMKPSAQSESVTYSRSCTSLGPGPLPLLPSSPPAPTALYFGSWKLFSCSQTRLKPEGTTDPEGVAAPALKNSFNNPAYYVLEGVPHQLLPLEPPSLARAPVPPATKNKVPITVPAPQLGRHRTPRAGEGSSSDEDSGGTLPPPDFPPPPLPDSAIFLPPNLDPLSVPVARGRSGGEARGPPPPKAHPRPPLPPGTSPASTFLGEVASGDDRSCSVLQMAKTLSEVDYAPGPGRSALLPSPLELQPPRGPSDYGRPLSFPPPRIRESIQEDLAEEVCRPGLAGYVYLVGSVPSFCHSELTGVHTPLCL